MTIEWLDEECTEAIVTRGWFRKESAEVIRNHGGQNNHWNWYFKNTGRCVCDVDYSLGETIESRRDWARKRIADSRDWVDTGRFPKARLLERK